MTRVCPGQVRGKNCSYVFLDHDEHGLCQSCAGLSCSKKSPCEVCSSWSDDWWRLFEGSVEGSKKPTSKSKRASVSSSSVKKISEIEGGGVSLLRRCVFRVKFQVRGIFYLR